MLWLPNGAGEALGDLIAADDNLVVLGEGLLYYCGPTNSSNTNNTGLEALRPLTTLTAALAVADDDDLIVLMQGFSEISTATLTIGDQLTIAGGGQTSGLATASLTLNAAATPLLLVGDDVEFRNVKFPAPLQSNTSPRIILAGSGILFKDCYFETNGMDAGIAMILLNNDSGKIRFDGCTFVNTATSSASRPCSAIGLGTAANVERLDVHNCTFDAGTVGWSNTGSGAGHFGHAMDFTNGTLERFRGGGNSFIRGADVRFGVDESGNMAGWIQAGAVSGGAFVRFTTS